MRGVIVHGGERSDAGLEAVHTLLVDALTARGWTVETLRLAEMTIHPCVGCFKCWLSTPGECAQQDQGSDFVRALVRNDAVLYLSPVTFGGYASMLKTALDRIVPYASPLFKIIDGEMHHCRRYPVHAAHLAVGWQRHANPTAAAIFHRMIERNGRNTRARVVASTVLTGEQAAEEHRHLIDALVARVEGR